MEVHIRKARPEDYPAVETIMQQVQQLHVALRPDTYAGGAVVLPPEVYRQSVDEEGFFVAEQEGQVVGILCIQYRHIDWPTQVTRNVIYVDSIGVEETHRGKGIGHAFFDFLKDLKAQKGYDRIELQVNAQNKAAYQMYRSYGFTDKSISMELL